MAQLLRREAVYEDGSMPVWYIAGVCTEPSYRHRGLMDEVMGLILERLRREGENWCFLLPVDLGIYRHLGFVHDFELRDEDSLEQRFEERHIETREVEIHPIAFSTAVVDASDRCFTRRGGGGKAYPSFVSFPKAPEIDTP